MRPVFRTFLSKNGSHPMRALQQPKQLFNGSYYAVHAACQKNDGDQVAKEDAHRRADFVHMGAARDERPQPAAKPREGNSNEDQ